MRLLLLLVRIQSMLASRMRMPESCLRNGPRKRIWAVTKVSNSGCNMSTTSATEPLTAQCSRKFLSERPPHECCVRVHGCIILSKIS